MPEFTRAALATAAGLTVRQLDYLSEIGALRADVGGERKQFSVREARLAVICGAAISMNVSPKALAGPIDWLRNAITFPDGISLPPTVEDIAVLLSAERLKPLYADGAACETATNLLAAEIYAKKFGPDPLGTSYDNKKALFEGAIAAPEDITKKRAQSAIDDAREMLAAPPLDNWKTFEAVETALNFELACRDKKSFFLHMLANEDAWQTLLHDKLTAPEGQSVWLVIDLRRLFRSRGLIT